MFVKQTVCKRRFGRSRLSLRVPHNYCNIKIVRNCGAFFRFLLVLRVVGFFGLKSVDVIRVCKKRDTASIDYKYVRSYFVIIT